MVLEYILEWFSIYFYLQHIIKHPECDPFLRLCYRNKLQLQINYQWFSDHSDTQAVCTQSQICERIVTFPLHKMSIMYFKRFWMKKRYCWPKPFTVDYVAICHMSSAHQKCPYFNNFQMCMTHSAQQKSRMIQTSHLHLQYKMFLPYSLENPQCDLILKEPTWRSYRVHTVS